MIDTVLLILALICFIAAALGVNANRVQLGWLGLAFWVATALV